METKTTATELQLDPNERANGIQKMWDVRGRIGHYVIHLTDRGWKGYQIESSDTTGESDLDIDVVMIMVEYFKLA